MALRGAGIVCYCMLRGEEMKLPMLVLRRGRYTQWTGQGTGERVARAIIDEGESLVLGGGLDRKLCGKGVMGRSY